MRAILVLMLAVSGCTSSHNSDRIPGDGAIGDLRGGENVSARDTIMQGEAAVADAGIPGDLGPEVVFVPGTATPFNLGALTIPRERVPNWSTVGAAIPDTSGWPVINALDHGATPDDSSDDDAPAINSAIASAAASHERAVVFLPAGEYRIVQPNTLVLASNVVLRGAGPTQTVIHSVRGASASAGIQVQGSDTSQGIAIVSGLEQGSNSLTLASAPSVSAGDYVIVLQENDDRIVPEATHAKGIGQVVRVEAANGNQLTISPHLRVMLNPQANPRVLQPAFIEMSGVEELGIDFAPGADVPLYRGATINFRYAVNCWVRNVRAENTYHEFVGMDYSARLTVADSHFKTMQKTNYTNAYTINFGHFTSDVLATNNILEDVWVTAMFSHSCSGNVYAYNFHTDIREDHGIMHHGTYPFENLVEGNHAYRITNDCWWGKQGPRLTFFRNRANEIRTSRNGACQNYGEVVAEQSNFLLNVANYYLSFPWCSYPDGCASFDDYNVEMWAEMNRYRIAFKGVDTPEPTTTFADNVTGTAPPGGWSALTLPPSLYLSRKPDFWCAELPWPAIGADVDDDASLSMLPAERRYRGLSCTH